MKNSEVFLITFIDKFTLRLSDVLSYSALGCNFTDRITVPFCRCNGMLIIVGPMNLEISIYCTVLILSDLCFADAA